MIADPTLYGRAKEERLSIIRTDMWGGETMSFDEHLTSYARYQVYGRDLSEARSVGRR